MHRSVVSRLERGLVGNLDVDVLRAMFDALGAKLELRVLWHGPQLDRLLDEAHAALAAAWKSRLEQWGWLVRVEASYSRFGERGRVDLLAFHPGLRILLVVEVKTDLVDAQGLLGSLDVKVRLARSIAADLGWPPPALVLPLVLFRDHSTIHRHVRRLAPLFAGFDRVGRSGSSWLRSPSLVDAPRGLIVFSNLAYGSRTAPSIGRHRIRRPKRPERAS